VEQDIRFLRVDGRRLAFATVGEGPPLVFGRRWISHLEADWDDVAFREFICELARTHRVIRFDRLGSGLSDRRLERAPSVEGDVRELAAVVAELGDEPFTLFATSCSVPSAAVLARREPHRVDRLVFWGAYVSRDDLPTRTKASLVEFVRTNWGLGAHVLASVFVPRASGEHLQELSRYQRRAAKADAAAAFLEVDLTLDLAALLPAVTTATLVLHRQGDRAVPIELGREVARLLPNARFVPLPGESHFPWIGERPEVMRALAAFLRSDVEPHQNGSPLSPRETEVLRLVASGMSNREIASTLILSEHTVHRHVANILRKLTQSTRAGAVALAARDGLI
jgi:pimeloyl-ACP methyl ester carboxylesterase/DNA-binding CsgD family transcriptional regulator